jgi:short-subunit dehydrogenase
MLARGRGQLVFIGSLSGKAATAGASVYCASKFGLRGFALSLRAELATSGVGVSLVQPGFVSEVGMYAQTEIKLPLGVRTRPPQDVADAVVDAIERNRGEVTVAPITLAAGAQIASVAPGLAAWGNRLLGGERIALEFEERQADKR